MSSYEAAYVLALMGFPVEKKQINMALDDEKSYKEKEAVKGDND